MLNAGSGLPDPVFVGRRAWRAFHLPLAPSGAQMRAGYQARGSESQRHEGGLAPPAPHVKRRPHLRHWHIVDGTISTAHEKLMRVKRLAGKPKCRPRRHPGRGTKTPQDWNPRHRTGTPRGLESHCLIRGLPADLKTLREMQMRRFSPTIQPCGESRCTLPEACVCSISLRARTRSFNKRLLVSQLFIERGGCSMCPHSHPPQKRAPGSHTLNLSLLDMFST